MPYKRIYAAVAIFLAVLAYFWGAGSVQIPKIGDEVLYLQIARVTGESGQWLPLRYEAGVLSTKPPLLYWLGIASTKIFGEGLFQYRLPVLIVTFLGAFLLYLLGVKFLKDKIQALWAACVYLGFISTYQQGRPFLVNSFEVLFLILPLYVFYAKPRFNFFNWLVCALSWGAVAWSKSFALIAVGFFSLLWASRYLPTKERLWKKTLYFGSAAVVSLGIFALWFAFDPDPKLLFQQFIIGENAVKFKGYSQYFSGLFTGSYTLFRIWLGPFANAGLYVLPLFALLLYLYQRRHRIVSEDKIFLFYILAFLIFYSLPTQRQENYILPAMGAFALLLARHRDHLSRPLWRGSLFLLDLTFILLSLAPFILSLWGQMSLVAKLLWVFAVFAYPAAYIVWGVQNAFPLMVFLIFIQLTNFSEPFNHHFTYFLQNAHTKVWVPSRKLAQYERFRYIAPGSVPISYDFGENLGSLCEKLKKDELVVAESDFLPNCLKKYEKLEEILDLKSRQTPGEVLKIATGSSEYLLRHLILIRIQE